MVNSARRLGGRQKAWYKPTLVKLLVLFVGVQMLMLAAWAFTWPPVSLSIAVPQREAPFWQGPIAEFERQHPRIDINLITGDYTTDELRAIYTADFQTPSPQYDLVYLDIIWTAPFAAAGHLRDLSDYANFETLTEFLPSEVKAGRYDEQLYRLPLRSDVGVLFSRDDLLSQINQTAPKSYAALQGSVKLLKEQQIASAGYLWQGMQYEGLVAHFVEILDGFGGFWIDSETQEVGLGKPEAVRAAAFLRSLIAERVAPSAVTRYNEDSSIDRFVTAGDTAFLRGWPLFWAQAKSRYPEVSLHPIPGLSGEPGRGTRGGWGLGISSASEHPRQAWTAIAYFTSEPVQKAFAQSSGFLPSRRALFEDVDLLERYPYLPQMPELLETRSVFRPAIAQYPEASKILQKHLWNILIVAEDPKTGMAKAAAETRQLLGQ